MSFHDRDDNIVSFILQAFALLEHGEGFADAGGGAQKHSQPTSFHDLTFQRFEGDIELEHVDSWLAQIPDVSALDISFNQRANLSFR